MKSRFDQAVSAALGLAAIAIATSVVARTFFLKPAGPPGAVQAQSTLDGAAAAEIDKLGVRIHGDSTDPITIVEFTDLECPACRSFHRALAQSSPEQMEDVQVLLVHFPLSMHRFALPAARALECARVDRRETAFTDVAFSHQDSLGLLSWGELARRAGIPDTGRVASCASDPSPIERIDASIAVGERIGVRATPTVFINGVHLGSPTHAALSSAIEQHRKGSRR